MPKHVLDSFRGDKALNAPFLTKPVGDVWSINVDTVVTAVLLGVVGFGFLWWVVRGATSGVPGKRQAFVELCFDFVDEQVKGIFHGDRKFVAPLALTVFVFGRGEQLAPLSPRISPTPSGVRHRYPSGAL